MHPNGIEERPETGGGPRRSGLIALAVALGFGILVATLFHPGYQTNDDPAMSLLAAGVGLVDAPQEKLLFSNVLLGRSLNALYRWLPGAPFYGMHLLLSHLLALAAIVYCVLRGAPRWPRLLALGVYLATAGIYFSSNLQFTSAAFQAALGGFCLVWATLAWASEGRKVRLWPPLLCGAALLFYASLTRFQSLGLATLFMAPVLGLELLRLGRSPELRPSRRAVVSVGVALAATAVAVFAARAVDEAAYRGEPGWDEYFERYRVRQDLQYRTPVRSVPLARIRPILGELGWSDDDWHLFRSWFGSVDTERFSTAELERFRDRYWALTEADGPSRAAGWWAGFRSSREARYVVIMIAVTLVLAGSSRRSGALLAALASGVGLLAFVVYEMKAPPRISFPLLSAPLAIALVSPPRAIPMRPWLTGAVLVLALAAAITTSVHGQWRRGRIVRPRAATLQRAIESLEPRAGDLYIANGGGIPIQFLDPLAREPWPADFRFVSLGWPMGTPWQNARLREAGIEDVFEALLWRPRTFLICHPNTREPLQRYYRTRRSREVEMVKVGKFSLFHVYRVVPLQRGRSGSEARGSAPARPPRASGRVRRP